MLLQQHVCLQVYKNIDLLKIKIQSIKIKNISACRQQSVPRTFKEISAVSNDNTTIKDIGRCYKIIRKTLVSSIENSSGFATSSSSDLIVRTLDCKDDLFSYYLLFIFNFQIRFCSKLNLPREVRKLADHIVSKAGNYLNFLMYE